MFLKDYSQETYVEITNYYSEVMDKIYYTLIKTYVKETAKLLDERMNKYDLIVFDETMKPKHHNFTNNALEFI